jgi:hypothetical protein
MSKGGSRPKGGRPGGRKGGAGVGPGPAYRPGSSGGGSTHKGGDTSCCPMVAAVRSLKRGKFRLARRYAAMSVRLLAGA